MRITLPAPWGRVGPWQTGITGPRRKAEAVEHWLRQQALERPALIDGLVAGRWSLRDAWVAYRRGTLDALIAGASDPLLAAAVAEYRAVCRDERARTGLAQLEAALPGARLSGLTPTLIQQLYARAVASGRKPNSVRRSLHRAVTELLAYHLGAPARDERMRDVSVPGEDDTREVVVTAEQVGRLLEAAPTERWRLYLLVAIGTAADRKPMLALEGRHFDPRAGTLTLPDTKSRSRWRLVRLAPDTEAALRLACAGVTEGEQLFPWTAWQVRRLWEATREAAGMPGLRLKDLRHLLPSALAAGGADRREIQALLGHASGSRQTDRYITPAGDPARLAAAAQRIGIAGAHVRRLG